MENDEDWKPTIHPMIPNVPHTNPTQLESQDQPITSESYGNLSPNNSIYIYSIRIYALLFFTCQWYKFTWAMFWSDSHAFSLASGKHGCNRHARTSVAFGDEKSLATPIVLSPWTQLWLKVWCNGDFFATGTQARPQKRCHFSAFLVVSKGK